ncbi:hypothetical protein Tco_1489330 [Tanacetum coccineum]
MSENEDTYHDTILDLEAKLKKNVDLILKPGNSLQGMFMLGPKPLSVYDQQLKHGLGYPNPYTLKQAISECPKLYVASRMGNIEIPLNVRDSEETLEDAFKKSFVEQTCSSLEMDIQEKDEKQSQKRQKQAQDGKDKVKSKPKSVKVRKSTQTKSKVNQVKKIQLEGLIAKPQVVLEK